MKEMRHYRPISFGRYVCDEFREEDHPRAENGQFGTAHVVHSAKYDEDTSGWQSKVHSVHATEAGAQQAHDTAVMSAYQKMRAADLKENGETEYPKSPTVDEAWGHLGNGDNRHVFGTTSISIDGKHDGEVHLVHEAGRDGDGDGETLVHGVYASPENAKQVASETADEVWQKHGETRGDELSDKEAQQVMAAHNAAHPEDHHIDDDLDFVDNDEMDAIADDWNSENDPEHHVTFNSGAQSFNLNNKLSYAKHFRVGEGNENETSAQYFERSAESERLQDEIRESMADVYPFAKERQNAMSAVNARREAMFPEEQVKAFPGLKKSNAKFREDGDFDEMGRSGVIETTRHKIEE